MLMEVALDVAATQAADAFDLQDVNTITTDTPETAGTFLMDHPTAKIIVVIDTHCIDNGFLLWRGTTAENLLACSLSEVSTVNYQLPSCPNTVIDPEGLHPIGSIPVSLR